MNLLGNIIWIICGGFVMAMEYFVSGFVLCCTIIGIPFGLQVFKLGLLALYPFGQTSIVEGGSRGCISILMNIIWFFFGIGIALSHLILGALLCITGIGIPFGLQHFKLMKVALCPFGRTIVSQ
ncbi:MAG: YccF domain-containing protein [Coprobacter sp.]|nr:YccF domain-containing protein [Coprobacter sp.]